MHKFNQIPKELKTNIDLKYIFNNKISLRVCGYPGEMKDIGYP